MDLSFPPRLLAIAVLAALPALANATDTPAVAKAREGFAGYDHPNQYLVKPATTIAENMMPVMMHPEQNKETQQKLADIAKKPGRNPTWLFSCWMTSAGWTSALTAAVLPLATQRRILTPSPARGLF